MTGVGDIVSRGMNEHPRFEVISVVGDLMWIRGLLTGTDSVAPVSNFRVVVHKPGPKPILAWRYRPTVDAAFDANLPAREVVLAAEDEEHARRELERMWPALKSHLCGPIDLKIEPHPVQEA